MLIQDLVIVLFMAEHGDLMYDYKHVIYQISSIVLFLVWIEDPRNYTSSQHAASTMSELVGTLNTQHLMRLNVLMNMMIQAYILPNGVTIQAVSKPGGNIHTQILSTGKWILGFTVHQTSFKFFKNSFLSLLSTSFAFSFLPAILSLYCNS